MKILLAALTSSFMLVGCTPRIEVAALRKVRKVPNQSDYGEEGKKKPKEPITINMNVKIEHEIIIKADKDVEELLETRSDLF
ncbi:YnbE family lipoprotein [Escherichia coli]